MTHSSPFCHDEWNSGSSPTCHTIGDNGGDLFLSYRGNLDWFNTIWHVPTADLSKVYTSINFNASALEIGACMTLMYTGAVLEKLAAGTIAYWYYDKYSAFLSEEIDLWFAGGLDDMAVNIQWKWNRIIAELENRTDLIGNRTDKFRKKKDYPGILEFDVETLKKYSKLLGIDPVDELLGEGQQQKLVLSVKNITKGNYDSIMEELNKDLHARFENITNQTYNKIKAKEEKLNNKINSDRLLKASPEETFLSSHDYSYFSKSMTSGKYNGETEEIYVSAPGFSTPGRTQLGSVYKLQPSIDYESPDFTGSTEYSRFGSSMTTLDINHDGLDDLVVSSPMYGPSNPTDLLDYYPKLYYGKVEIFLGRAKVGLLSKGPADIELQILDANPVTTLGFAVSSSDCTRDGYKDLLIGAPFRENGGDQRGALYVVSGLNVSNEGNETKLFYMEEVAMKVDSQTDYQWFGSDAVCSKGRLYVGASGMRSPDNEAKGAIYIYDFNETSNGFDLKGVIASNDQQSKFGGSLSINEELNLLAVGASSQQNDKHYHAGCVYIYNLTELNSKLPYFSVTDVNYTDYKIVIHASSSSARFGKQVIWHKNDLIVSAPQFTDYLGWKKERGCVFLYKNAFNLQKSNDYNDYSQYWEGDDAGARFGTKLLTSNGKLFVGSPWKFNGKSRLAGGLVSYGLEGESLE